MRILVLCHEFPPIGGGAAAICAAITRHYVELGHEAVVLTMAFGDLPARETVDGCDVRRLDCGRRRKEMASPWEGLRWAQRCWPEVQRLHAERPFDAVHAHFLMPAGIVGRRAKRKLGLPLIVTIHGSDVPGYNRERLKLVHHVVRPWWRKIAREADLIVSASESLFELMRRTTTDFQGLVIPNGFEPGRFPALPKERRILLCSRLVERKGFQYFLRAIADLDLPGWEIDLVGDGPMFAQLNELAAACRTPVRMHGWIDNTSPRLAELYGRATIMVFPTEWDNFAMALLEGMSAGCAVVTTDVSGNPEAIGDAGYLVPPQDEAALRRAVLELTADAPRCAELGRRAQQRADEEFPWRRIASRYLELFGEMTALPQLAARST